MVGAGLSSCVSKLQIVKFTAPTVEENLDLDLKHASEAARDNRRILRLWWGGPATVVMGCADKVERDVFEDECGRLGIGVIKRITGGGTVLQSDGVLNYSYTAPDLHKLDIHYLFDQGAELIIRALSEFGITAAKRGISDVAVGDRKISGNAQARKWHAILLHGTLLVDIDRPLLETLLPRPTREPDYRANRPHGEFITTLRELGVDASRGEIEKAFARAGKEVF